MKSLAIAGFFLSFIFIAVNTSRAMDKTLSRAIKIDTDDLMVNQNLMKGVERYNQELRKNNV